MILQLYITNKNERLNWYLFMPVYSLLFALFLPFPCSLRHEPNAHSLPTACWRSHHNLSSSNLYTFTAGTIWKIFQYLEQHMIAFNNTWQFYKKFFPDNFTWLTIKLITWIVLLQCYSKYKATILQHITIWKYMTQKVLFIPYFVIALEKYLLKHHLDGP